MGETTKPIDEKGKKLKGEIKFNIQLNDEQKEAKKTILNNTITILKGSAGSGKSLVAAQTALDCLFKKQFEKIIITRPIVTSGEEIGILPGSLDMKLAPYTAPVYDNMYRVYNKEKIDSLIAEGRIEVIPVGFMRGRNFTNTIVIVDEAQNLSDRGLELIMTRLCMGSKMIICGDAAQVDLKNKKESGFEILCKYCKDVEGFAVVGLHKNHRHPIVESVLSIYSEIRG